MKRYDYHEKRGIIMFFRKTERKRYGTFFILAVGALATVGAISVVKYGKQMVRDAGSKVKDWLNKDKCVCPVDDGE